MKKKLALFLSLVMCLTMLSACGGGGGGSSAAGSGSGDAPGKTPSGSPEVVLEFGHIQNPGHALYIAADELKALVEERSEGRIQLNLYPASQLGSAREMMEQVTMGELDITFADASDWASALNLPQLGVFNLPFLNKDLSAQIDVINEVIPTAVPEMLEGTGLRLLATYSNGIRQPLLKDHPINSIEDIQGLKMRTPETKMYVDLWNALGASTVTSAWSEAYTVLQSGVADAVEADDVGLVSMNLQEIGRYMSKIGHLSQAYIVLINEDKWNTIPEDLQQIFTECLAENQASQLADRERLGEEAEQTIANAGVQINEVSDQERQRMRDACQSIYDSYAQEYGLAGLIAQMESYNHE